MKFKLDSGPWLENTMAGHEQAAVGETLWISAQDLTSEQAYQWLTAIIKGQKHLRFSRHIETPVDFCLDEFGYGLRLSMVSDNITKGLIWKLVNIAEWVLASKVTKLSSRPFTRKTFDAIAFDINPRAISLIDKTTIIFDEE